MIQTARNELIRKGFKPSQIEAIDGGYVNGERRLEFWFVPKDGEIPSRSLIIFQRKNSERKNEPC